MSISDWFTREQQEDLPNPLAVSLGAAGTPLWAPQGPKLTISAEKLAAFQQALGAKNQTMVKPGLTRTEFLSFASIALDSLMGKVDSCIFNEDDIAERAFAIATAMAKKYSEVGSP